MSREGARGCGYRKVGGLYLVSDLPMGPCCQLPFELSVCPCCGAGIKPARGWTWVEPAKLLGPWAERPEGCRAGCEVALWRVGMPGRAGLLWIGESFYPTPADYLREARSRGLSRRISTVPKGFEVGKTWVLLAHRRAITHLEVGLEPDFRPGIFSAFLPQRIEVVVTEAQARDAELIQGYVKRGLSPVVVVRDELVQAEMF